MIQPDATQLHEFIVDYFSLDELKTLCFKLGVAFDDLGGDGRAGKARELVLLMKRQTRLDHLAAHLSLARPDAYRQRFHDVPDIPLIPSQLTRNPRQVFISHAHQDAAFAQRLAADLRARDYPIWIAPDSIIVGEDWPDAIDRGLDESGVVVVALTPHALTSHWVRKEMSTARLLEGHGLVQLVLLDLAECAFPSSWRTYQFASFRNSYEAGLNQLQARLEGRRLPPGVPVEMFRQNVSTLPTSTFAFPGYRILSTDRIVHEKTDIEFVRVPAGPFIYGDNKRTIDLPEYWIGRTPVTNAQYKRFLDTYPRMHVPFAGEKWAKPYNWDNRRRTFPPDKANHPVVLVHWEDAQAFCDWAGLALPTEAQWEKAARGTDMREWPWGNSPATLVRCNFNKKVGGTTPVGEYSPLGDSPYGCIDMAGNVWEWTVEWYMEGETRAMRGGSWCVSDKDTRASYRSHLSPLSIGDEVGFRVVALLSDPGF